MDPGPALFRIIDRTDQRESYPYIDIGMVLDIVFDSESRTDEVTVTEGTVTPDTTAIQEYVCTGPF
jgi:hypothetical protein